MELLDEGYVVEGLLALLLLTDGNLVFAQKPADGRPHFGLCELELVLHLGVFHGASFVEKIP